MAKGTARATKIEDKNWEVGFEVNGRLEVMIVKAEYCTALGDNSEVEFLIAGEVVFFLKNWRYVRLVGEEE